DRIAGMAAPGADLPRATLAPLPTPLHHLPRFSAAIGAEVWMKRDDIGALVLSGDEPGHATGNLLLDRLYGAEVRFAGTTDWAALAGAADRATEELRD